MAQNSLFNPIAVNENYLNNTRRAAPIKVNDQAQLFTSSHPKDSLSYVLELLETNPEVLFFDVETTGLNTENNGPVYLNHRIIELGLVGSANQQVNPAVKIDQQFKPDVKVHHDSIKIHGITNEMLKSKPRFVEFAPQFIELIRGKVLVAHNAPFDVGFLNQELRLAGFSERVDTIALVVDSLVLAKDVMPQGPYSLDALQRSHKIDIQRDKHAAYLDSEILCAVFYSLLRQQNNLFSSKNLNKINLNNVVNITKEELEALELPAIQATAQEQQAHQQYLEFMATQKDENKELVRPLWLDYQS